MPFATYPSLNQATVFITGAASGIGEETLRAFAEQDAKLGFIDMDEERGRAVTADLRAQGTTVEFEPWVHRHKGTRGPTGFDAEAVDFSRGEFLDRAGQREGKLGCEWPLSHAVRQRNL